MAKSPSPIHSIYAVVGADRFLRSEAIESLRSDFQARGESFVPIRFDGETAELAEVLDEVRTVSIFGDRRLVMVDDTDSLVQKYREPLERFCESPACPGVLILLCDSLPKNTRLYKRIAERGRVIALESPKGRSLFSWLQARAVQRHGKQLEDPAAARLVELTGEDLGALDSDLAKLSAFVGDRARITLDDVSRLTGCHREEMVFRVMDAMVDGDAAKALSTWEQVVATDRAAPGRAIGGLSWGIRRMVEWHRDVDRGVSVAELARRIYAKPEVLELRMQRFTRHRLEQQQRDLLAADVSVKTGGSSFETAVEKFIVKHTVA